VPLYYRYAAPTNQPVFPTPMDMIAFDRFVLDPRRRALLAGGSLSICNRGRSTFCCFLFLNAIVW
jgi:hypothetical protein